MISKSFKCCVFVFLIVILNSTNSYGGEIDDKTAAYKDLCEDIWTIYRYFMSTVDKVKTESDIMNTCMQLLLSSATGKEKHSPSSPFTYQEKGKLLDNILKTLKKSTTIEAISITTPIPETEITTISNTVITASETTVTFIVPENETTTTQLENSTEFGISETTPRLKLETTENINADTTVLDNDTTTVLPKIGTKTTQNDGKASTAYNINTNFSDFTFDPATKVSTTEISINTARDIEITTTTLNTELEMKSTLTTEIATSDNQTSNISTTSMPEDKTEFAHIGDNSVADNDATSTVADMGTSPTNNNIETTSTTKNPATLSVTSHGSTNPTTKYNRKVSSTKHFSETESDNNATTIASLVVTTTNPFESYIDTTVNYVIKDTDTNVTEILPPKPTETENHLPENQAGFDWKILQWPLIALAVVLVLFGFIMLYRCLKKHTRSRHQSA